MNKKLVFGFCYSNVSVLADKNGTYFEKRLISRFCCATFFFIMLEVSEMLLVSEALVVLFRRRTLPKCFTGKKCEITLERLFEKKVHVISRCKKKIFLFLFIKVGSLCLIVGTVRFFSCFWFVLNNVFSVFGTFVFVTRLLPIGVSLVVCVF